MGEKDEEKEGGRNRNELYGECEDKGKGKKI